MLKPAMFHMRRMEWLQPPSGGCVLKRRLRRLATYFSIPAAFGRLCVETSHSVFRHIRRWAQPPSGGCVLKHVIYSMTLRNFFPAAFGRLCVETELLPVKTNSKGSSRLRAAVC